MATLILLRHGESQWNKKGIWTGLRDIPLSEKGIKESKTAASSLANLKIDIGYTSSLKRSRQTLNIIKKNLNIPNLPAVENKALNERDYGELTGKNKWEIKKQFGDERFLQIRRSWDVPIPKGETLKDVYGRVVPYYQQEILPRLKESKTVLIVAHGNSLRALVKYLENISDNDIQTLEIATGEIYIYKINKEGKIISKEARLSVK